MRNVLLLLSVVAWMGVACATRVDVSVEERADLSQLRTWNWLPPGAAPKLGVDAPHRSTGLLHKSLGRLVEKELRSHGFERAKNADFFVIYQLVLEQRKVVVYVPRAPYLLLSMSYSPSYWIEAFDQEIRVREDLRLVIGLVSEPGQILWRGVLERKVAEGDALRLDEAVAQLLERLLAPAPVRKADPPAALDGPADASAPPRGRNPLI